MECTDKQYSYICHLLTKNDRVRNTLGELGLGRPPQSGITKSAASKYIDQLQAL